MEELLKKELGTSKLVACGSGGGGCISSGESYDTDSGRVFVKINGKSGVSQGSVAPSEFSVTCLTPGTT